MRLEDAQLCLLVAAAQAASPRCPELCRAAIAGGVDLIQISVDPLLHADLWPVRNVCREEDALLVIDGTPEAAVAIDADGVHLSSDETPVGYARAVLGNRRLIGLSSRSIDEATMAIDLDPDYLLHYAQAERSVELAGFRAARAVLFAAGARGLDEARRLVEGGAYRLAVVLESDENEVTEAMSGFSRLLGRCI